MMLRVKRNNLCYLRNLCDFFLQREWHMGNFLNP